MNTLTLGTAKSVVARALNFCATDPRVVDLLNEAQARLLNRPVRAVGCDMQYTFCLEDADNGCLTLPRQIRTVERWALCGYPGVIRSEWFDFGFNGAGQWTDSYPCDPAQMKHQGTACCFNDPTAGATDEIQVTVDVPEVAGTYLWLYGYDENNQWIRSKIAGVWYDGERVDLGSAPLVTTNKFTRLVRAKKPVTNGIIRLYQYDSTVPVVVQALAFYEPSETDPIYRRVLIPGLADCSCSCSTTTTSTSSTCAATSLTLTCVDDMSLHVVRCRLDGGNYVIEVVQ